MGENAFSCTLILGGARSGKSAHAEQLARANGSERVYVATAAAYDDEMRERIAAHKAMRADDGWRTVEEQHDLAGTLSANLSSTAIVLVDCLTLWLTNRLLADADLEIETKALCSVLEARTGPVLLVSNETGLGIVPDNALARRFSDAQGRLNQSIASIASHVVFVAAGLPLTLKEPRP